MGSLSTVIIGGGLSGCCLASELGARGQTTLIVDVDLFGRFNSAENGVGLVHQLWSTPEARAASARTLELIAPLERKLELQRCGAVMVGAREGVPGSGVDAEAARRLCPALVPAPDDGRVLHDPAACQFPAHRLRLHYLNRAEAAQAQLLDRWKLVRVDGDGPPYTLLLRKVAPRMTRRALSGDVDGSAGELQVQCDRLINCAGAWAGAVAGLYGGAERPVYRRYLWFLPGDTASIRGGAALIDVGTAMIVRYAQRDRQDRILVAWDDPGRSDWRQLTLRLERPLHEVVRPVLARRLAVAIGAPPTVSAFALHEGGAPEVPLVGPTARPGIFEFRGGGADSLAFVPAMAEGLARQLTA